MKRIENLFSIVLVLMLVLSMQVGNLSAFAEEIPTEPLTQTLPSPVLEDGHFDGEILKQWVDAYLEENYWNHPGCDMAIAYWYSGTDETWFYNADEWIGCVNWYKLPVCMHYAEELKSGALTKESVVTGITLEYSLYIPEGYEEGTDTLYPMVMFIPDSTGAGLSSSQIVEEYYGAAVWAGDEDQEKHPSFVLVPAYTGTVTDDNWNASEQLDATVNLITYLTENYSIDRDRLYTTGQSMGCMSSLYLNSKYPDLFAASLYVSGQWDISVLDVLEDQTFFYVTAGGDEKASGGQDEVMALFDQDQVPYSYQSWDAQEDADAQNDLVQAMIDEGNQANMIRFETGTVLNGEGGMEHMASFNYAYKISALRDWLFEQSR